jgi:hypothetical protein
VAVKLRTHPCSAAGCQHVVSTRMLMCLDHWRMVPAPLRREIVSLAKSMARDMDCRLVVDYRDAVARAVAAVQEKQERKAAASAGPSGSLFSA